MSAKKSKRRAAFLWKAALLLENQMIFLLMKNYPKVNLAFSTVISSPV